MIFPGGRSTYIILLLLHSCLPERNEGRKVFRYNQPEGISSLDPAFAKNQAVIWAVHQLYNTLVEVDTALQIVPYLARSWEISSDGLRYRFHLRRGIFFHDNPAFPQAKGRELVAEDVVFSLNRIIDPATASPGAWIFNGRVSDRDPFIAPNDSTVDLHLKKPFPPILGILSMQYCGIVPQEVVERYGSDFRQNPCGTGPFRYGRWEEGQALLLRRNEKYWERDAAGKPLPYLDGVRVSFLDSKATEFLEFTQGRLDFINDIDASFKDEVLSKRGELRPEWRDKARLIVHPFLNTEYLGILMDDSKFTGPLQWKQVRKAINYGFDRKKMILYLRNSLGTPAGSGFIPLGLPSFDSTTVKGYDYDPREARRLLREAGYGQGKQIPAIKLLTIPNYAELASFIAKQLEETGFDIQVEVVQKSLLLEQTAKSEAGFFRGSWMADYPDAENYLSVFYGKNPAPPNYTRYQNPQFDQLYEQALLETNDSARYELYKKMDRLILEDAPVVPLWYDKVVRLVQPGISGFEANSLNLLELRNVRKP